HSPALSRYDKGLHHHALSYPTRRSSHLVKPPVTSILLISATSQGSSCCPFFISAFPEKHEHSVEGRLTPHPNFICGARNWRLIPDRKSTRLNSSHVKNSYAVCSFKKKNK